MPSDFHILLIDDSPTDALIIGRALRENEVPHRLTVLQDGRTALDYLTALKDSSTTAELEPDLVLLDLNLPGLDGFQVLASIKNDDALRAVPVVVLTTSSRDEDVSQAYQLGANTFLRKPDEYPRYVELVSILDHYWRRTALRPRRPEGRIDLDSK